MTITKEESLAIGELLMYIESESAKYIPDYNLSFMDVDDESIPFFYNPGELHVSVAHWAYETQMKTKALKMDNDNVYWHCEEGDFQFRILKSARQPDCEIEYPKRPAEADKLAMAVPEFIAWAKMCKFLDDADAKLEAEEKARLEKKLKIEEAESRKRAEKAMKILERYQASA